MKNIIEVCQISKHYRIGVHEKSADTLIGSVVSVLKRPLLNYRRIRSLGSQRTDRDDVFWALKDVSFSLKEGDVLGIIGKNGAGKSTLLKVLSRVTDPSEGEVRISGRIASLLEVGTGFHPELTGRENVFMNGTILGMRRSEIMRKFDEIVAFSGVEKFLDTAVKFYSSGMKVRLGFAVAAHLEPDILIVDEVLAVGDAEFQRKCLGKMNDVSKREGRTVLFVSHNLGAVKGLCNVGLLLKDGRIESFQDDVAAIVGKYYSGAFREGGVEDISMREDRRGDGKARVCAFELENAISSTQIELGRQLGFRLKYISELQSFQAKILISVNTYNGECIFFFDSETDTQFESSFGLRGDVQLLASSDVALPMGRYFVNVALFANGLLADRSRCIMLRPFC